MNVSTKQQRIAELAKQSPEMSFHSLNHHMDREWLREAYGKLKKTSSPGTDGVTVEAYGRNLNESLKTLLEQATSRISSSMTRRGRFAISWSIP